MLRQLKENNEGIVLVVVLMIVITMMVLVLSILTMKTSSVSISEDEIKQIQSEILSKGLLAYVVTNKYYGGPTSSFHFIDSLDNITFSSDVSIDTGGIDVGGIPTNSLLINMSY